MFSEFSIRLRKAMKDANITASELSRLSGVGKSDISYYLKGRYLPKQDKCYLLARALRVDPGWLMTGVEPVTDEEHPNNEKIRILMQDISQLSPEEVDQLTAMFNIMFKQNRSGK